MIWPRLVQSNAGSDIKVAAFETPDLLTGTKTKFKHINIKYPFQARSSINVGVIITTKKFQSQFAEIPIACLRGISIISTKTRTQQI